MEIRLFVYVIICVVFVLQPEVCLSLHCDQEHVDACEAKRDQYLADTGYNLTILSFPHLTEIQLRASCSFFRTEISPCFMDIQEHCIEQVKTRFTGYINATSYVCGEDLEVFLEFKDCILIPSSREKLSLCSAWYEDQISKININNAERYQQTCRAMEDLIDCESQGLQSTCGDVAGNWIRTYNTKLYTPEIEFLCPPPSTLKPPVSGTPNTTTVPPTGIELWVIGVIGGASVLFAILIIVMIIYICRRLNHDKDDQQAIRSVANHINNERDFNRYRGGVKQGYNRQRSHDSMENRYVRGPQRHIHTINPSQQHFNPDNRHIIHNQGPPVMFDRAPNMVHSNNHPVQEKIHRSKKKHRKTSNDVPLGPQYLDNGVYLSPLSSHQNSSSANSISDFSSKPPSFEEVESPLSDSSVHPLWSGNSRVNDSDYTKLNYSNQGYDSKIYEEIP